MSKYIDAVPLHKEIRDFKKAVKSPNNDYMTGYICALSFVEGMIANTPTADVVEVRHGHWITRNIRGLEIEVKCSVCGSRDFYPVDYKNIRYTDFCGDCGAKMDLERRSENEG